MITMRLSAEQLALGRVVGWRRLLVLGLLAGAADETGRVQGRSARDVARLLGVDHRLVDRDVRELARVGLLGVAAHTGRASTITIQRAPDVGTIRKSPRVRTPKVSPRADHQEVPTDGANVSPPIQSPDTQEVPTSGDHQEVPRWGLPPKGGAAAPPAHAPAHPPARPTGAPLQLAVNPKPRVKTWD